MNNLNKERQIIERVLTEYIQFLDTYSYLESKLIISEDRNNYLIVLYGLLDGNYYHDFIIHLEITENGIDVKHDDIDIKSRLSKIERGKFINHGGIGNPFNIDFAISLEKIYSQYKSIFARNTNPQQPIVKFDATPEELSRLASIENRYILSLIAGFVK